MGGLREWIRDSFSSTPSSKFSITHPRPMALGPQSTSLSEQEAASSDLSLPLCDPTQPPSGVPSTRSQCNRRHVRRTNSEIQSRFSFSPAKAFGPAKGWCCANFHVLILSLSTAHKLIPDPSSRRGLIFLHDTQPSCCRPALLSFACAYTHPPCARIVMQAYTPLSINFITHAYPVQKRLIPPQSPNSSFTKAPQQ